MGDLLDPIAPLVVAGASTFPAFHIFREFAKVVLKPIVPLPSKTIPQLAQSTPSVPSATLRDDGPWFPTSFFAAVRAPAFTPEPTPIDPQSMLPQAAAPVKNLDHLPGVLSSDPARAMVVFIFIVTSYLFVQFFARHIHLRRHFSPVTHIISAAITVYLSTLTGSASHYSLLNMPVTLHQAKESALPVASAALATFSMFNMLISVVESTFRVVLAGIELSAVPKNAKRCLQILVFLSLLGIPIAYRSHQLWNGLLPFEVTVRREIESNLASVDPRFVAIVIMAFVALCVVDMLLGFLQWFNISLLGLSVVTSTCGPVVLVVRIFQALFYVIFRRGSIRLIPTRGMHQHETGLADVARPTDASGSQWIRDLEAKLVTQQSDLGARDSEIARLKRRIEEAERAIARKQRELTSTVKIVEYQDAKIAKLQLSIAQANEMAQHDKRNEKLRIEKLKKTRTRPTADAGVQTLPVVLTSTTIVPAPAVEKAEFGVQVDSVVPAGRVLVERSVQVTELPRHLVDASTQSVQHNPALIDSATQTTETLRVLVDSSAQVQEPLRQFTETAVQAVEPTRVFADSTTQTNVPPPTVPAGEHEKALMEVEELRIRLHDIESKPGEVDVAQAEGEVHNGQEAHEQDDASVQLPNGGPKVSIQAFAAFLGAKLNQALAPQVVDSIPEYEEKEDEGVDAETNLQNLPTDESSLALVTDTTAPIPNVSPDMYSTYEAIAGKKFTIPADPDVDRLDQMPLRQWIMAALRKIYVDRLGKYSEVIKSQTSKQVEGSNIAATQALGQGNHTLMISMWQLAQAHTLSKMSPEEVKGSLVPAYVTVDWRLKKPMDDDRIGRSFYKLQRHVLDAIRDKAAPNPFVISALNLMEFSIAFAERLYSDIKEPDSFKNSSNPHIRQARLWIKQEVGVWVMDEDLLALAELIQDDWKWKSSFRAHLKFDAEQDPGYALLQIKRGMELETSVAEEAGEQPLPEVEEKKPKKRSDGFWGHEMAHYGDQVKEGYDEPSVDESVDQKEEAEVEARSRATPEPQPVSVRLQPEVVAPPVETQTVQPLEEPEPVLVLAKAVEPEGTTTHNKEKDKGKGLALVKQKSLTEAEKELGPANFEPTANFSWDDELARQPTTNTQPSSTTQPQQGRVYHDQPSHSFHGHGNNRSIPLQIEPECNPNIPRQPASVAPTTDTPISFASGLTASRHAPTLTGSMASMHAPRPTGLYSSIHAPSPPTPQPAGTMASMHAPKPTGSMASMHAPKPSTSPVVDRNRSMHADEPPPLLSPPPNQHNRGRGRRRGGRPANRLGSHQIN